MKTLIEARETAQKGQTNRGRGRSRRSISGWLQHVMNARMSARIRRNRGTFMGMDVLILHTVGRRTGRPRQSPVAWFPRDDDSRLIVASGGGNRHPDWYLNLMAHPDEASIELPGRAPVPVSPHRLDGVDRQQAWQRIASAQPRYAKYQRKTDRQFPVVQLTLG